MVWRKIYFSIGIFPLTYNRAEIRIFAKDPQNIFFFHMQQGSWITAASIPGTFVLCPLRIPLYLPMGQKKRGFPNFLPKMKIYNVKFYGNVHYAHLLIRFRCCRLFFLAIPSRRSHACPFEPPHPAGPPNAVKRSRRKYQSGVARDWLFGCKGGGFLNFAPHL